MLLITNARHRIYGEIHSVDILIEKGLIADVSSKISPSSQHTVIDFDGDFIVPGFIDIHTHGAFGTDFNSPDYEKLSGSMQYYASQGVTSLLAAIVADTRERMLSLCSIYAEYATNKQFPQIAGLHLEGPFLSPEYSGAISKKYLIDGDAVFLNELQRAARGNIKLITVSPEVKNILHVIKAACDLGIVVSIGHSGASNAQTQNAISAGAAGATHLFNAMKPLNHHEGGIISAVLESDIYCEMIADGIHVDKDIFRMVYAIKGKDSIIPVTDSIMATGMKDGIYSLGQEKVTIKSNQAALENGTRAGSVLGMNQALKNIINFLGIPLWDAVDMISKNPAHNVLHEKSLGQISIGSKADFVRLDQDFCVVMTFQSGNLIYYENDYHPK